MDFFNNFTTIGIMSTPYSAYQFGGENNYGKEVQLYNTFIVKEDADTILNEMLNR